MLQIDLFLFFLFYLRRHEPFNRQGQHSCLLIGQRYYCELILFEVAVGVPCFAKPEGSHPQVVMLDLLFVVVFMRPRLEAEELNCIRLAVFIIGGIQHPRTDASRVIARDDNISDSSDGSDKSLMSAKRSHGVGGVADAFFKVLKGLDFAAIAGLPVLIEVDPSVGERELACALVPPDQVHIRSGVELMRHPAHGVGDLDSREEVEDLCEHEGGQLAKHLLLLYNSSESLL